VQDQEQAEEWAFAMETTGQAMRTQRQDSEVVLALAEAVAAVVGAIVFTPQVFRAGQPVLLNKKVLT
jgi:hypothetical protein